MAKSKTFKFPEVIHVIVETPANGEPYLDVVEEGFNNSTRISEKAPGAVYELIRAGEVEVRRIFVGPESDDVHHVAEGETPIGEQIDGGGDEVDEATEGGGAGA